MEVQETRERREWPEGGRAVDGECRMVAERVEQPGLSDSVRLNEHKTVMKFIEEISLLPSTDPREYRPIAVSLSAST